MLLRLTLTGERMVFLLSMGSWSIYYLCFLYYLYCS